MKSTGKIVLGLALGALFPAAAPMASSLTLTSTITNGTGSCTTTSSSQCSENYGFAYTAVPPPPVITSVTADPTTYTLANTFNQSGSVTTQFDFGVSAYTPSTSPKCSPAGTAGNCLNSAPFLNWNFQDNYEFTTPSSGPLVQGALLSFSLPSNIGLSGLEARIVATNAPSAAGLVGTSPITVVDGWTGMTPTTSGTLTLYQAVLATTALTGGTSYFLEVRGEAQASAASYSGTVTFTPAPLPAAAWLLLSGLFGFGAVVRGKRAA
jgi:hypothetical protein